MDEVTLLKDGTLKLGKKKIESFNGLLYCLHRTVVLEEGATLKSVFRLVEPYPKQISCLVSCDMAAFLAESHSKPKKPSIKDVKFLELHWISNSMRWGNEEEFEFYPAFNGRNEGPESYAIEYCHWGELKSLPVILNKEVRMIRSDLEDPSTPSKTLFTSKKDFTLYDLIHGIFWELGFNGSPKERNKFTKELFRRVKEIDNGK